jgi:aromatic ring-opening dioxygenase catalytic subunit (LigB family)
MDWLKGCQKKFSSAKGDQMSRIVAGMASSHGGFALRDPSEWDVLRERNRAHYKRRYGVEPPIHPKIAEETMEVRQSRYKRVADGLNVLREKLREKNPDALILIGDDQGENYKEDNLPQIVLYLGGEIFITQRQEGHRARGNRYSCHSSLAEDLLSGLVEEEFDIAISRVFPNSELISHAHASVLEAVMPEANIPIVLIFLNAIHTPAVSPARCYALGQAIRAVLDRRPSDERLMIYASGGLSHFTAGYPWKAYKGPYTYGSISEEFDRNTLQLMAQGAGEQLARLTSQDLLDNGDIELRTWIVLLGAVGNTPAHVLAYEPFYSGIMGLGVAYWDLEDPNIPQSVSLSR